MQNHLKRSRGVGEKVLYVADLGVVRARDLLFQLVGIPQGREHSKGLVGAFGVVPEQPVDEGIVEAGEVIPEKAAVVLDEVLGERPVEAFDAGVHLGASGVRVKVNDVELLAGPFEQVGELAPVVGLYLRDGKRGDGAKLREEVRRGGRAVVPVSGSEGELPLHINGRVHVPLDAVHEADDGVGLDAPLVRAPYLLAVYGFSLDEATSACHEGEPLLPGKESPLLEVGECSPGI